MAYQKEDLINKALKAIKDNKLYTISDVVSFLPISRQAYYNHELDKVDELKNAIEENKINTKNKLLKKWEDSTNATLQMALMKLICTDDERKRLSMEYKQEEHKGEITIIRKVING